MDAFKGFGAMLAHWQAYNRARYGALLGLKLYILERKQHWKYELFLVLSCKS